MSTSNLKTGFIRSTSVDPWHNMALEEALLNGVVDDGIFFYLWQNEKTVVIGRHQNVWKECRWKELEADGGKLARRLSGGGAVYHDMGNINFTFTVGKKHYDLHRQLSVILGALKKLGISAEFAGRNDLVIRGAKFSGNAFHRNGHAAMHHGTLLVNADFSKLAKYLNPPIEKLRSKGVESVRSRVVNLVEVSPSLRMDILEEQLQESFFKEYGKGGTYPESFFEDQIETNRKRFESWDWRFGKTPEFDVNHSARFPWGGIEFGFSLKDAVIKDATVFSDSLLDRFIDRVREALTGCPYRLDSIKTALSSAATDDTETAMVTDITDWLGEKEL